MAGFLSKKLLFPANLLCISEMFFIILSLVIFGCHNEGIGYLKIMHVLERTSITNNVNFYIVISVVTILTVFSMCIFRYFNSKLLSPIMEVIINGVLGIMFLLASIILCVVIAQISQSVAVQEVNMSYTNYEATVAFSFMSCVFLFGSTWYSFTTLRKRNDLPLNVSHSNADLPVDIPT